MSRGERIALAIILSHVSTSRLLESKPDNGFEIAVYLLSFLGTFVFSAYLFVTAFTRGEQA